MPRLNPDRMACLGGETRSTRHGCEHMEECLHCESQVRFDLVDHPFFGFKKSGCRYAKEYKEQNQPAPAAQVQEPGR